eukprot:1181466-Rhodomonas_salina.1
MLPLCTPVSETPLLPLPKSGVPLQPRKIGLPTAVRLALVDFGRVNAVFELFQPKSRQITLFSGDLGWISGRTCARMTTSLPIETSTWYPHTGHAVTSPTSLRSRPRSPYGHVLDLPTCPCALSGTDIAHGEYAFQA